LSKVEKFTLDGTTLSGEADWLDNHGVLSVTQATVPPDPNNPVSSGRATNGGVTSTGPTTTLFVVDTAGVGQTFIRAHDSKVDTLTVRDDSPLSQTVDVTGGTVKVQEGAKILAPSGVMNGVPNAPIVVSSPVTGGNSSAYLMDNGKALLDTFFRDSTSGNLTLQQQSQGFVQTQTLSVGSAQAGAVSVAIDGNLAVVGVPGSATSAGGTLGVAYLYQFDGTNWVLAQTLQPSDRPNTTPGISGQTVEQDGFGTSVAILGNTIVVGAPHAVSKTTSVLDGTTRQTITTVYQEGAVYVFGFQGTTRQWAQSAKLASADQPATPAAASKRAFGSSVAVTQFLDAFGKHVTAVLIGAPNDSSGQPSGVGDGRPVGSGSAYFFEDAGTGFVQLNKVLPSASVPVNYHFGTSVAIDGLAAVVGAPSAAGSGIEGGAYVYQRNGVHPTAWIQKTLFTAGTDADGFGSAVAISAPGTYDTTNLATLGAPISPAPIDVFVGMPRSQTAGGSVYEYHAAPGSTTFKQTTLSGTGAGDDFGASLAVRDGQLVVSSAEPHYAPDGKTFTNRGVLQLYQNTDPTGATYLPLQVARFQPADDLDYGSIGSAVALQGNTIFAATGFDGTHPAQVAVFGSSLRGSFLTSSSVGTATVYATTLQSQSISVFRRDAVTGYLTFVQAITQEDMQTAMVNGQPVTRMVDGLADATRSVVSGDGATVFVFGNSEKIAVFQRDADTGLLTFSTVIADPLLGGFGGVSGVATDATGSHLYVTSVPNSRVLVFARNADGSWSRVQSIQDGVNGVADLNSPFDLALSPDGRNLYVAATFSNAVVTFSRDAATGLLSYVGAKINGQGGVVGLHDVSVLAISPNGKYVIAAGDTPDSVVAFTRDSSGALTFAQDLVIHSTDPGGLPLPTSISVSDDGKHLYVGCGGDLTNHLPGVAWFSIDNTPSPVGFNVNYSGGIASLNVTTGAGDDSVRLGSVTGPASVSINTGAGQDSVVDQDSTAGQTVAVDLGGDANSFDLRATGAGSTTSVLGGDDNDTFHVFQTAPGSTVTLNGGAGDDLFRVAATQIGSDVTIVGGAESTGDTLEFDSTVPTTYPVQPTTPDGSLRVGTPAGTPDTRFNLVNYTSIESVKVLTVPQANPGSGYVVQEGSSLTLDASASIVPNGPATYVWDVNGDGSFGEVTGVRPTLTWAQLNQAGIARAGNYTVRLRVTDAAGVLDEASTTLTVVNQPPTNLSLSVNNNVPVASGVLVPITATATDAGGSAEELTYQFDVNNDGVYDVKNTTGTFNFAFASPGTFVIGARVTDADGASVTTSTTVNVSATVQTITGASAAALNAPYLLSFAALPPKRR
jgi:6-phosphogluconolactonase (cycloisomerase 2 family)